MRNEFVGHASVIALASMIATASCADYGGTAGTTGSSGTGGTGGTTGSAGTGGTVAIAGSSSTGGTVAIAGSSSTGAGSVTTLSGTESLGSLTTAEATQLCNDAYAYFGRVISRATLCKATALTSAVSTSAPTDAVLQQNCSGSETTCLQASPTSPSCGDIPTPCTATVAEYSTCIVDQATAYNRGVSGLPGCATVTLGDMPVLWDFVTADLPASCTALDITCAGLNLPSPH
jgi:hypothetical protein